MLNQAEAEARNGNDARGLLLLNAIRNRTVTTTDRFAVGSLMRMAFIQASLTERRVELMDEGFRWDDIHRLSSSYSSPLPERGDPSQIPVVAGSHGTVQLRIRHHGKPVRSDHCLHQYLVPVAYSDH